MPEKLVSEVDGKITTPPHSSERPGLRPGDELTVVEVEEGLLVYRHGADTLSARWRSGPNEDGRRGGAP